MNPKRFFVDEPQLPKPSKFDKILGLFFKQDTNPGYYKDGFFYDVKSTFTGWNEEEEFEEQFPDEKKYIKIPKEKSLFGKDTLLRKRMIKKILFVPNYRLEDTKNFFEQKKILEKNIDNGESTEYNENIDLNLNDENSINNNSKEKNELLINNLTSGNIERIYQEIKANDERIKQYEEKLKYYSEQKNNIFQLIKDLRKKNDININKLNKLSSEEEGMRTPSKLVKNIEQNEIQLLTQNEQKEILMFFVPDEIIQNKFQLCESCKEKGHSKRECVPYPDPEFDKSLKFCVNCGGSGHLYCRKGLNDDENICDCIFGEDDDDIENLEFNNGVKYFFDFDIRDGDKMKNNGDDGEKLYEEGAENLINEDKNDNKMINTSNK